MATTEPLVRRCGDRLETRVVRGGSWNNNDQNVRSAYRNRNNPNNRNNNKGFRVVAHGFHFSILRRLRLAQREPEAGAAGSWPCHPHPSSLNWEREERVAGHIAKGSAPWSSAIAGLAWRRPTLI